MSTPHSPTPEFRHFLEEEVARSFHAAGPDQSSRRVPVRRRVRTIATVVAAVAFGAIAGAAPTQVENARQRQMLTAAAETELKLMAMRVELARAEYEEARKKFEVGLIGSATLAMAEAQLRQAELQFAKLQLNQEEMRATAAPPNDALTAPLVGSRDFVSERMRLEIAARQEQLRVLEQQVQEAERRARAGAEGDMSRLRALAELETAKAELAMLAGRLDLRRDYLDRNLRQEEIDRRLRQMELMHALQTGQQMLRIAEERLTNLHRLREVGAASEVDVKRAELELLEAQLELQNLAERMKQVERE